MKGIFIQKYGDSSVLQFSKDLEIPKLQSEYDVLVEIHAASLNPVDYKMRSGLTSILMPYKFPLILGHDMSGVVTEIGKKVTKFNVGDNVKNFIFLKFSVGLF
jgi:alcohol dehydrogenase